MFVRNIQLHVLDCIWHAWCIPSFMYWGAFVKFLFCISSLMYWSAFDNVRSEYPASCTGLHLTCLYVYPAPCTGVHLPMLVLNIQLYVLDSTCQCLFGTSSFMYWIAFDMPVCIPSFMYWGAFVNSCSEFPASRTGVHLAMFVRNIQLHVLDCIWHACMYTQLHVLGCICQCLFRISSFMFWIPHLLFAAVLLLFCYRMQPFWPVDFDFSLSIFKFVDEPQKCRLLWRRIFSRGCVQS